MPTCRSSARRRRPTRRPPQRRRPLDELVAEGIERDADLVAKVLAGWSLPEPCNAAALADLEDNFGGALGKFLDKYERAVYAGQLGN